MIEPIFTTKPIFQTVQLDQGGSSFLVSSQCRLRTSLCREVLLQPNSVISLRDDALVVEERTKPWRHVVKLSMRPVSIVCELHPVEKPTAVPKRANAEWDF